MSTTKPSYNTAESLQAVSLPKSTNPGSVITHGYLIGYLETELKKCGYTVVSQEFRGNTTGQMALGIYRLTHPELVTTPDLELQLVWFNSYERATGFRCALGACRTGSGSTVLLGRAAYPRKHSGSATSDMRLMVEDQLTRTAEIYQQIQEDARLLTRSVSPTQQAQLLGRLFFQEEILTLTQLGVLQRELKKPSFTLDAGADQAWTLYHMVTQALKSSHPEYYLSDHQRTHEIFLDVFREDIIEETPQPRQSLPGEPDLYYEALTGLGSSGRVIFC